MQPKTGHGMACTVPFVFARRHRELTWKVVLCGLQGSYNKSSRSLS